MVKIFYDAKNCAKKKGFPSFILFYKNYNMNNKETFFVIIEKCSKYTKKRLLILKSTPRGHGQNLAIMRQKVGMEKVGDFFFADFLSTKILDAKKNTFSCNDK